MGFNLPRIVCAVVDPLAREVGLRPRNGVRGDGSTRGASGRYGFDPRICEPHLALARVRPERRVLQHRGAGASFRLSTARLAAAARSGLVELWRQLLDPESGHVVIARPAAGRTFRRRGCAIGGIDSPDLAGRWPPIECAPSGRLDRLGNAHRDGTRATSAPDRLDDAAQSGIDRRSVAPRDRPGRAAWSCLLVLLDRMARVRRARTLLAWRPRLDGSRYRQSGGIIGGSDPLFTAGAHAG